MPVTLSLRLPPTSRDSVLSTCTVASLPTCSEALTWISSLKSLPAIIEKSRWAWTKNSIPPDPSFMRISLVPPPPGDDDDCRALWVRLPGSSYGGIVSLL